MKAMGKKRYRIDFTPLDKYFFSNEDRYRLKSTAAGLNLSMDYYQVSRRLPQQTTLLGALRYLKLKSIGQIPIVDKKLAVKSIGESSFRYKKEEKERQDFKAIGNISPVGIGHGNNTYFPNAFDINSSGKKVRIKKTTFTTNKHSNRSTDLETIYKNAYILQDYNEKDGIDHFLIASSESVLNYDQVFISSEAVGIKKNNRSEEQEDTLYKQTSYSLAKGFTFRIEVDMDIDNAENGFVIPMGADGHLFQIALEEIEKPSRPNEVKDYNYVHLTGDTLVNDFDVNNPIFSIAETAVFRHLRSKVQANNSAYYHSKPYRNDDQLMPEDEFSRSEKYMLLKCGSVFWFENHTEAKAFTNLIDQEQNLISIGYNHYTTEKIDL